MLVLTRKKTESIVIGETTIKVMRIKGNRVYLAIDAPKTINVVRSELLAPQKDR